MRRLDVRRRHVLAGRVDDQLLLAVDDPEVAVLVDLADVAGVRASRRRRAPRRSSRAGCGSPSSRPSSRVQHLTVLRELELDARASAARRCRCGSSPGGLQVRTAASRTCPTARTIGTPIAWKNSSTSRGVGAAPTTTALDLVEARASPRRAAKSCSSASATAAASSSGTGSPACSSSDLADRGLDRALSRSRCSSGCAASIASSPAFSFSQIRGTAKNTSAAPAAGRRGPRGGRRRS